MLILPATFWNGDDALGSEFTLVLLLGTFMGNFAKNLFALPRPPSPPVKLLQHAMRDFGFPSVHTLNAFTVSGVLLKYYWNNLWFYFTADVLLAQYYFAGAVCLGLLWCISIPLSRMYVGVHSPLDCLGGTIGGLGFLFWWLNLFPLLWRWMTVTQTYLIPGSLIWGMLMILIHPRSQKNSPSFRNNVAVVGLIVGNFIGVAEHQRVAAYVSAQQWVLPTIPVVDLAPILHMSEAHCVSMFRILTGLCLLGAIKVLFEYLLRQVFTLVFILPVLSTIKSWIAFLLYPLSHPGPTPLNNVDHPAPTFAEDVAEYQKLLLEESSSLRRRAAREAMIVSRAVVHVIIGMSIVSWVRIMFPLIGL
jgi:hypothetical protein